MRRYSRTGQAITLPELQSFKADAKEDDLNKINQILYHALVKEPARWMQPRLPEHEVPWAIAQQRAISLVEAGHVKMADVFDQYADYGIFTDKDIGKTINKVKEKIRKINILYQEYILKPAMQPSATATLFFKDHKNGELVTTRQQLHQELQIGFGGDNDSDGEGYDSETAEELYPSKEFIFR